MEFPSKGITSPPSVTCSDKEQDVCSQTLSCFGGSRSASVKSKVWEFTIQG